jgi:hypothetical protein
MVQPAAMDERREQMAKLIAILAVVGMVAVCGAMVGAAAIQSVQSMGGF